MLLTPEQVEVLNEVMGDPVEFCRRLHIKMKDGSYIPFGDVMTDNQADLIRLVVEGNHKRIAVVKARQMGITTAIRAACFYKCYTSSAAFRAGIVAPVIETSEEVFDMDCIYYDTLPPMLQRDVKRKKNTLKFTSTNSYIRTFSADGRGEMRGYTLNLAHLTEFAFYRKAMEFLASVLATAGSGVIVIESTPNHYNDALHQIVQQSGYDGGWHVVFLPWSSYPRYRAEAPEGFSPTEEELDLMAKHDLDVEQVVWRREKIAEFSGDIHKFRKEYPITIEEAYSLSEDNFFGPQHFEDIEIKPVADDVISRIMPANREDTYALGVDLAGGIGQDYSVACVVSRMTNAPVAFVYSNQMSMSEFSAHVYNLSLEYRAPIYYEQNNHGYAFAESMHHLGVNNIVPHHTTGKSKWQIYNVLRKFLEDKMIDHLDSKTYTEMRSLIKDPRGGAPEHPPNMHDDRVIAYAIALYYLKDKPQPISNWDRIMNLNNKTNSTSKKGMLNKRNPRRF